MSSPSSATCAGSEPSARASGSGSGSAFANTNGPHVSTATGTRPSASCGKSGSSSLRGAARRRPSSPYVQAWYGHCSVSRRCSPSASAKPRWRQTLTKPRSTASRSRVTTTGVRPTCAAKYPGCASWPRWPTYCQAGRKIRSCSRRRISGSVYQPYGRVVSTGENLLVRAMVLHAVREPLRLEEVPVPEPQQGQVRLRVSACGVCRTDLPVVDGALPSPKLPLVPGHQIVGRTEDGRRLGVPWLGWTDGTCRYCRSGRENLCESARFTGYDLDGGYAEWVVADERYCLPLPEEYDDLEVAPLLCAGLIGYRSLRLAGDAERIGLYGFGASAHIVVQVARHEGRRVFAFTRPGDEAAQSLALELGCEWAGPSDEPGPEELDAALIFAPVGELVPAALRALARGGVVVCAGIHMSDIPSFPYELLWEERAVRSVANLTRRDGEEFLALAPQVPVRAEVEEFPLEQANEALDRLRAGRIRGAAVLRVER